MAVVVATEQSKQPNSHVRAVSHHRGIPLKEEEENYSKHLAKTFSVFYSSIPCHWQVLLSFAI
jgi:hypothetical protein